jgi:ATP-dependent Clp protease protease subunit
MSLKRLPTAPSMAVRPSARSELSARAVEQWDSGIRAATGDDAATISIFDVIGQDWDGSGVTAARISAALRSIGNNPVVVNINSPGGDMFEGLAIYSLLREHPAQVTVRVLGLAASAASIIAMAGDEVQVARAGFLMIHNAWVVAIGNRNDLIAMAETLAPFDAAMADIYAARTGLKTAEIESMLDAETWIGGSDAVAKGFADGLLPSDATKKDTNASGRDSIAAHRIDALLAKQGVPRSERRQLIKEIKSGTQNAVAPGTRDATETVSADAADVIARLKLALAAF